MEEVEISYINEATFNGMVSSRPPRKKNMEMGADASSSTTSHFKGLANGSTHHTCHRVYPRAPSISRGKTTKNMARMG